MSDNKSIFTILNEDAIEPTRDNDYFPSYKLHITKDALFRNLFNRDKTIRTSVEISTGLSLNNNIPANWYDTFHINSR